MKSDMLGTLFTGVLSVCALAITGMLVRREFFPPTPPPLSMATTIANWQEFQGGQPLTAAGRATSLVVFSDYQCPACRALARSMDSLRQRFPTQLSVYYRNAPIPSHRFARSAAFAAECAAGVNRFEAAHRLLFVEAESIGVRSWGRFAAGAGIPDTAAFARCVRDSVPVLAVRTDEEAASRLKVRVTPTLLLNDEMIEGAMSASALSGMIERHVRKVGAP